jgi:uroporphyrinogen-III synthase
MVPQPMSSGWSGKRALLIKGDGGRNTLADGLLSRNMAVDALSVYRRLPPLLAAEAVEALELAERPVVVFSSSEGVAAFGQMLDREPVLAGQWRSWPVIATHERVAQAARSLSCKTVRSVPPHDEAIIRAIESLS